MRWPTSTRFRSVFGLGTSLFSQTHPGGCTDPGAVIGLTPKPRSTSSGGGGGAGGDAAARLLRQPVPTRWQIWSMRTQRRRTSVSISFGECEAALGATGNAFVSSTYQQAVTRASPVFVASGDQGAAGCFDTSGPDAGRLRHRRQWPGVDRLQRRRRRHRISATPIAGTDEHVLEHVEHGAIRIGQVLHQRDSVERFLREQADRHVQGFRDDVWFKRLLQQRSWCGLSTNGRGQRRTGVVARPAHRPWPA